MEFEWDEAKASANIEKHGVAFEDAKSIFEGFIASSPDVRRDYGEQRTITTGTIHGLIIVVVVHTERSGKRRIISARRGNRDEREAFEAALLAGINS